MLLPYISYLKIAVFSSHSLRWKASTRRCAALCTLLFLARWHEATAADEALALGEMAI